MSALLGVEDEVGTASLPSMAGDLCTGAASRLPAMGDLDLVGLAAISLLRLSWVLAVLLLRSLSAASDSFLDLVQGTRLAGLEIGDLSGVLVEAPSFVKILMATAVYCHTFICQSN